MSDIRIDYNTANIVFPINDVDGKELLIYLPPASQNEIKANASVLGLFSEYIIKRDPTVLIVDWDIYVEKCIKELLREEGYNIESDTYKKALNEHKDRVLGMLERSIVGGYYFNDNFDIKPVSELDNNLKDKARANLLFFIVYIRYMKEKISDATWREILERGKIDFTLLTAMEYKNTITTRSDDSDSLKK